jgi:hypothetical protein
MTITLIEKVKQHYTIPKNRIVKLVINNFTSSFQDKPEHAHNGKYPKEAEPNQD